MTSEEAREHELYINYEEYELTLKHHYYDMNNDIVVQLDEPVVIRYRTAKGVFEHPLQNNPEFKTVQARIMIDEMRKVFLDRVYREIDREIESYD